MAEHDEPLGALRLQQQGRDLALVGVSEESSFGFFVTHLRAHWAESPEEFVMSRVPFLRVSEFHPHSARTLSLLS